MNRRPRNRNEIAWNRVEVCPRCGVESATVLIELSNGSIARVCPECRTCRRLRPFATKQEFINQTHNAAIVAKVDENGNANAEKKR